MGAWYIRITGKRRKEIDVHLLVQAVIALGEQFREQENPRAEEDETVHDAPGDTS
jgi:hypothetical protein